MHVQINQIRGMLGSLTADVTVDLSGVQDLDLNAYQILLALREAVEKKELELTRKVISQLPVFRENVSFPDKGKERSFLTNITPVKSPNRFTQKPLKKNRIN